MNEILFLNGKNGRECFIHRHLFSHLNAHVAACGMRLIKMKSFRFLKSFSCDSMLVPAAYNVNGPKKRYDKRHSPFKCSSDD